MFRFPRYVPAAVFTVLATLGPLAAHDARARARIDFVGVFHPVFEGAATDPARCPASHPVLVRFSGEAYTTLGHARFEQSHCQPEDGSSFIRGDLTTIFDNNESLRSTYSGALLPTPTTATDGRVIVDGAYRNLGGTGRLQYVHGRGITAGVFDTIASAAEVTISGTL